MAGSENEKIWLVKSSANILGPFALEEVIQLLTSRHLSLIDEIRSPDSRWLFIREHKSFANIVNFIREQQAEVKEDTGSTHFTGTKTAPPKEKQILSGEAKPIDVGKSAKNGVVKPQIYGAQSEVKTPNAVTESKRISVLPLLVILLIVSGAWYFFSMDKKPKEQLNSSQYAKLIDDSMLKGDYEKASGYLQALDRIEKLSIKRKIQSALILIVHQNQNVQARQLLDELAKLNNDPERKYEIENLRAISFLNEGQYEEARKILAQILKDDPANEPALVNNMASYILESKFSEAMDIFRQVMLVGVRDSSVFLMRSLAVLKTATETSKLQSVADDLVRFVDRFTYYHPEAMMLLIGFQTKLNMQKELPTSVAKILKIDPDLTKKHILNPYIHQEAVGWKTLGNVCQQVANEISDVLSQKSLVAYCKFQMGDISGALDLIEKTRVQFQRDSNLISFQTFLLYKLNRAADAKALIQANPGVGNELMLATNAWLCQEQKDWTCAEREWKRIMTMDNQSLAAYAGLALVERENGNKDMSNDFLKQGLTFSDKYRPLIELKEP